VEPGRQRRVIGGQCDTAQ